MTAQGHDGGVDAWASVVGVVIGAVLGALLTYGIKRDEYRRQSRERWDVDKRVTYQKFLAAANDYERRVFLLQIDPVAMSQPSSVDPKQLDQPFERLQAATAQITLLASNPIPITAMMYVRALVPSIGELEAGHDKGPYGWAAAQLQHVGEPGEPTVANARGAFIKVVRHELRLDEVPAIFHTLASTR